MLPVAVGSPRRSPSKESIATHVDAQPQTYHPLSFHVVVLLMPFSILGVLGRLGLQALATYSGQNIFSLAYVQALGCLIMGFCLALKEPFSRYYPPAYIALTTGFCGSLTTFSGWQLDIFKSWVNADSAHRSPLRDTVDGLGKSLITVSLAMSSLYFGMFLASQTSPYFHPATPPSRSFRHTVSVLSICTYAATFPAYFLLPRDFRHQATSALLFSFPGALSRYLLSTFLNPLVTTFPLGTYAANSLGTALLAIFRILQSLSGTIVSNSSCTMLQGLSDGYCGCLTTVSTFAAEIAALKGAHKWRYGLISWITGQLLFVCIFGTLLWARAIEKRVTCSFD